MDNNARSAGQVLAPRIEIVGHLADLTQVIGPGKEPAQSTATPSGASTSAASAAGANNVAMTDQGDDEVRLRPASNGGRFRGR